jgi:hypothetical protein
MKIYISGPMSNKPDLNFPLFAKVAAVLRAEGHTVFNPAEKPGEQERFDYRTLLRADLLWLCEEADAICLLPNWGDSKGALAEASTARALGLEFMFWGEQ